MLKQSSLKLAFALLLLATCTIIPAEEAPKQDASMLKTGKKEMEMSITAERMEILLDGNTIELTTNVRYKDDVFTLTSDRMLVFLDNATSKEKKNANGDDKEKEKKSEKTNDTSKDNKKNMLKRIEADGHVVMRKNADPTESVLGDSAVYDVATDTVTLTGNCVVSQGGNVMNGKKVVFNRKIGKISVWNADINIKLDTLRKDSNQSIIK